MLALFICDHARSHSSLIPYQHSDLCAGIKKVALLDFDVHHGNGTQACIRNTAPSLTTHRFETPYSKGLQEFPVWKPWLDSSDAENIFFAR